MPDSSAPDQPPRPAALLLVSFPHHLLHALSALRHERRLRGVAEDAPATLLLWSYRPAHHATSSPVRKLIEHALQAFPWVRLHVPSRRARTLHLSPYRRLTDRVKWFRRHLGGTAYETCFYSHDASADHTAQALMQAFPDARRICYGDPPGFLYPARDAAEASHFPRSRLKQLFWKSRMRGMQQLLHADQAIIAVDFGSPQTAARELHVLPRELLVDTLYRIKSGLDAFAPQASAWVAAHANGPEPAHLLLLSNFSDSGMARRQDEIALYTAICATHVPPGALLYLKPHIGSRSEFVQRLLARLSGWQVEVLPPAALQLPIEFMPELLASCRVLSVSSSSALVAYLFGCNIAHALTDELIRRHFKPSYVDYMCRANRAITDKTYTYLMDLRPRRA